MMSRQSPYGTKLSIVDKFFGIKCPHCNKRGGMRYGYSTYTRGRCNTRIQAIDGGNAYYCMECSSITWCIPYDVWVSTMVNLPNDFTFYPDSEKAKYFPDFKFNVPPKS